MTVAAATDETELLAAVGRICSGLAGHSAGTFDPQGLVETASIHRLSGALFLGLQRTPLPEPFASHLQQQFVRTTTTALQRVSEIGQVLARLESAGVRALAYKGPLLSVAAYGHAGARVFDDIDLLVQRRDLARATAVLESAGYTRDAREHRLGAVLPLARKTEVFRSSSDRRLPIELHVAVAPWPFAVRLDTSDLIARASPVTVANDALLTLAPEDLLLVLCAHAATHEWQSPRYVVEIAGVARRSIADWDTVRRRAREARLSSTLAVALRLADAVCGLQAPSGNEASSEDVDAAVRTVLARWRDGDPPPDRWRTMREQIRLRERASDRARYFLRNELQTWLLKLPWERWLP